MRFIPAVVTRTTTQIGAETPRADPSKRESWLGLILIRVLRPSLFPQDRIGDLRNDAPLETVANRSVPMARGPNVDHTACRRTFMLSAIAALRG